MQIHNLVWYYQWNDETEEYDISLCKVIGEREQTILILFDDNSDKWVSRFTCDVANDEQYKEG